MSTPAAPGAVSRLEGIVSVGAFSAEPAKLAAYAVDGIAPSAAVRPGSPEEICEVVKFAAAENLAIIPCGARTKIGIGLAPRRYDIALDLTRLNQVVAYDPGDLTLSVEPGVLLHNLDRELGKHGQMLPLGAPFLASATVGGTIVSGVDGPLRQFYGTARDFVLGMEFVNGEGVAGKSGGRVVKNVTGYDLHKLMIGSLGTLGIVTRINFRTFPAPQEVRAFAVHFASAQDAAECRDAVAASALRPLTFEIASPAIANLFTRAAAFQAEPLPSGIFSPREWTLITSFAGTGAVLDRCESDLRKIVEAAGGSHFVRIGGGAAEKELSHVSAVITRLREFAPIALAASPACTIAKISVLPEHLEHALAAAKHAAEDHSLPWAAMARGLGVIYVALLPEERSEKAMNCVVASMNRIQEDCTRLEGHCTIPWCPLEWKSALKIWGPDRDDLPLMQKVKTVFDPRGIFAPGRFMGGI
jgi:glycolate dehydrogenase FAD-binding subunit